MHIYIYIYYIILYYIILSTKVYHVSLLAPQRALNDNDNTDNDENAATTTATTNNINDNNSNTNAINDNSPINSTKSPSVSHSVPTPPFHSQGNLTVQGKVAERLRSLESFLVHAFARQSVY